MITKILDDTYNYEKYNVKVTDKNHKSFVMMCGGNLDLYWVPENWKDTTSFTISKDDEFTYNMFAKIFKAVEQNDDKYNPALIIVKKQRWMNPIY